MIVCDIFNIRSGRYVKAFCKGETSEKVVALTFDDGPDPLYTSEVLDVLKEYQTPAAFFCIGSKAERYPDIVCRMQAEGHLIGNHSYTHTNTFPFFPFKRMLADVVKAQAILEEITSEKISFFRPPFGVTNPTIANVVKTLDFRVIGWSIRSFDTKGEATDKILNRILKQLAPGSVILLHDRMPRSAELLRKLLEELKDRQYKVVRIDSLFKR